MKLDWDLELEDVEYIFSHDDYKTGMEYYEENRVLNLRLTQDPGQTQWIECDVRGTQEYPVKFYATDDRVYGRCNCQRYLVFGKCEHLAAAMIAYVMEQWKFGVTTSDPSAKNLLESYLKKSQIQPAEPEDYVRLVPILVEQSYKTGQYPTFTFKIGRDRLYVLRDIQLFLKHVSQGDTISYGKALVLEHTMENFDPHSRRMILALMDEFEVFSTLKPDYTYFTYYSGTKGKGEITLRGDSFDRWFDIMSDQPAQTQEGDAVSFVQGNPQVRVGMEKRDNCAYLKVDTEDSWRFFGNGRVLYAHGKHSVMRCSREFHEQVFPLLESRRSQMRLALEDLPTFCGCVLPQIQDMVTVEDPHGLLEDYLPEECIPCFYFDLEDDILSMRLTFRYGEKELEHNTPVEATPEVRRDIQMEQKAEHLAQRYLTSQTRDYVLVGEDKVFNFLTGMLESFHEYGEVYISDRLRRKRIQPEGAQVGISVSDGMLELDLDTGDFPPEELAALYQSLLRRQKYHRLADGRYLELNGSPYEKMAEMTHMLQLSKKDLAKGKMKLPAFRSLYLDNLLTDSEGLRVTRNREFRAMIRNFKSIEESDYKVPESVDSVLRPYQRVGFQWLKTLESCGFGGILADEMGLGKTLQVIAYLASVDRQAVGAPSLVVCPTSLILNWGEELQKFAPQLRCALIMGNAAARKIQREEAGDLDVWVTSYELLRQDVADYRELNFYCCVLDEGQHIKNQATLMSKAVKQINCRQRFVLTGTPIENRLSELWNLFDFLMPGYLFSHSAFRDKLEKPIVKSKNPEAAAQLRRLVQPFLLRRLKKDVLKELPPKIEHVRRIPLSEAERKVYYASVQAVKGTLGEGQGKLQILAALTQLRQICCDPNLCFENYQGETSKLDACLELCAGMVENGHQILVFSQFTSMLDRIRARLDEMKISNFTLQGSTPKDKRAQLVKRFNEGQASVFLISLKAGGTGLNLTAADVVIHFDPWWNIAAQDQATDRAHRIGQQAHVQVYKLIAKDTIEEKILNLQDKKAALMETVSGDADGSILTMSKEDLLALLDD